MWSLIVELQYSSTDHRKTYEEIKTSVSGAGLHDRKQFRQKATRWTQKRIKIFNHKRQDWKQSLEFIPFSKAESTTSKANTWRKNLLYLKKKIKNTIQLILLNHWNRHPVVSKKGITDLRRHNAFRKVAHIPIEVIWTTESPIISS